MFMQSGAAREYQLILALQDAKQTDQSIQEFYSLLSGYWEELNTMETPIPETVITSAPEFVLALQKQRDRRNILPCDFDRNLSLCVVYPASKHSSKHQ